MPVLLALVGSVHDDLVDAAFGDLPGILYSILQEPVVGSIGRLHLYVRDKAGLALLVAGLGDVRRVALHLLAALAAVGGVGVVGVLHAGGTDELLVAHGDVAVLVHVILLVEHAVKQRDLTLATHGKDVADDDVKVEQTLAQRLIVRAVHRLRSVLGKEVESLLAVELVGDVHCLLLGNLLAEGLMDNLIAREPGDVAADELAVHADGATGYLVLLDLLRRQILVNHLVEVDMLGIVLLVLGYAAEQLVVGVDGRALVVDVEKAHGLTPDQVEADVLVELLIAAAATFLQYAHRYKDAESLCGGAHVAVYKERAKNLLVNVQQYVAIELVVP